jgi:SAM-dependent methyltransferase
VSSCTCNRTQYATRVRKGFFGMDKNILPAMREDWDRRARRNAKHYIESSRESWDDREFFRSGEVHVANYVMRDMHRICGGYRSPLDLTILEIGCGVGRMTRMLSRIFGRVTAVDVSEEMIDRASANLADVKNLTPGGMRRRDANRNTRCVPRFCVLVYRLSTYP